MSKHDPKDVEAITDILHHDLPLGLRYVDRDICREDAKEVLRYLDISSRLEAARREVLSEITEIINKHKHMVSIFRPADEGGPDKESGITTRVLLREIAALDHEDTPT